MLAARRPLPLVLVKELFGVWFFKINLTVGQFWAPKGGPGAKSSRSKNTDLRVKGVHQSVCVTEGTPLVLQSMDCVTEGKHTLHETRIS